MYFPIFFVLLNTRQKHECEREMGERLKRHREQQEDAERFDNIDEQIFQKTKQEEVEFKRNIDNDERTGRETRTIQRSNDSDFKSTTTTTKTTNQTDVDDDELGRVGGRHKNEV